MSVKISAEAESKIQLLQVTAPFQMNQVNSQGVTSTTWSKTSRSIVTASIDGSNSGQGLAHTATITNAINGVKEEQQVALVYFLLPNCQNVQGQMIQIIDVHGTVAVSWPRASKVDVQGVAEFQPANAIQEQDFAVDCLQEVQVQEYQAQQIISNDWTLYRRELSPNVINGVQQQQVLVYIQQSNDENIQVQVGQIIDVDGAATVSWPGASTVDVQGVAEVQPANAIKEQDFAVDCLQEVQVQDSQAQKIISNDWTLHRRELSPNTLAACAVTSTSRHQQMPLFSRIQTVDAGAEESSHQLQKDSNDTEKWQVLESATNPANVSTPIQHSQVSESVAPNLAIAATSTTSTSAESQSSNSDLNAPRLRTRKACPCLNCNNQDEKNIKSKKKEHPCHAPGCTKVYRRTSKLLIHYRCHTGERPFVCSWTSCGKKFFRSHHLEIHQRIHTGERNFQCSECFRQFARKHDLSRHFKIYHIKET